MQPGGTSQELLGVDSVREFNVLRDDYGAEYGKRPGAQVLIVTQGGTNQVHGSVYEFLRNSALDARNYFNSGPEPPFQRNQFGGSLGGPMRHDRSFAFGNYEGFRQHLHQAGVALVPDANARAGMLPCKLVTPAPNPCPASGLVDVGVAPAAVPLLNLWPVPSANSPDFGGIAEVFNSPLQIIRDDFGTVRFDQDISVNDRLTGVYTIDDSDDNTPTSANLYSTDLENLREQVASLDETHVFSPRLLNVAPAGVFARRIFLHWRTHAGHAGRKRRRICCGQAGGDGGGGRQRGRKSGGAGEPGRQQHRKRPSHRQESLHRGRSRDRCAGTARPERGSVAAAAPGQRGSGADAVRTGDLHRTAAVPEWHGGYIPLDPAPTEMNWRSLLGAWYVQDAIRITPKLTLSAGFRDEFTTGWNEAHDRASSFVFDSAGVIQTAPNIGRSAFTVNHAKFLPQPRLALAWSPYSSGGTVFRAGLGMYNDLQDALGYRMDQNAPYNPSYSIASLPVADLPLPVSPVPAKAKIAPAGVQPDLGPRR